MSFRNAFVGVVAVSLLWVAVVSPPRPVAAGPVTLFVPSGVSTTLSLWRAMPDGGRPERLVAVYDTGAGLEVRTHDVRSSRSFAAVFEAEPLAVDWDVELESAVSTGNDWADDMVRGPVARQVSGFDGSGVTVAVIDSGVEPSAAFNGNVLEGRQFHPSSAPDASGAVDVDGHGTHVAGVVAGGGRRFQGVAPGASILPVRITADDDDRLMLSGAVEGLLWAADVGADVVNMSFGSLVEAQTLSTAVGYAEAADVVMVASAGNTAGAVTWPAADPRVIAVGAVDWRRRLAGFSAVGPEVELVAPGVNVMSASLSGEELSSGTSMAAPRVAGAAALLRSARPELSAAEVRDVLTGSAFALGDTGRNPQFGFGLLDVASALHAVLPEVGFPGRDERWPPPPGPTFGQELPQRVFDSRVSDVPVGVDPVRVLVSSDAGLAGAAVSLTVTAIGVSDPGFVSVDRCGSSLSTSTVQFVPGEASAATTFVAADAFGGVCFTASTSVHVVVDVLGWWSAGSSTVAPPSRRLLDTRPLGRVSPDVEVVVPVDGFVGEGQAGVSLTVTVVDPVGSGWVTVWPCDAARPETSVVNFVAGQTVANAVSVPVGQSRAVCVVSSAETDVLVDAIAAHRLSVWESPVRLLDSRSVGSLRSVWQVPFSPVGGMSSSVELWNVTVLDASEPGFATVGPCVEGLGSTSVVNVAGPDPVANMVAVSSPDEVCVHLSTPAEVLVDRFAVVG